MVQKVAENKIQKIGVIEQIDGQMESPTATPTVTFDLTISAETIDDAFLSIEDNLCAGEENQLQKVPFKSEVPSCKVRDTDSEDTLFTLEVKVIYEETFLEKVHSRFESWDPLFWGKKRGKLVKFVKRI